MKIDKGMIAQCKVLVVGAGGLGCEILKNLARSGFKQVDVIDMDTIELSNLNRQFLFRSSDIGKSKAEVAAQFISRRVPGCQVTPHNCRIEEKELSFYQSFHLVICGLDSINARLWLNNTLIGMVAFDTNGKAKPSTIIPFIDGGTEGFQGNARVVIPYMTPCIACGLDLYPPAETYPLCTIANTPRLPEHCVEYVKAIQWGEESPFGEDVPLDADNPAHIQWVLEQSQKRAGNFNIQGVDLRLVKGVVKRIIPAVASTNAIIAACCVLEAVKMVSNAPTLDNYLNFQQEQGASMQTVHMDRNPDCIHCSQIVRTLEIPANATLNEFVALIKEKYHLVEPIVQNAEDAILCSPTDDMRELTGRNLPKRMIDLNVRDNQQVTVTDRATMGPSGFLSLIVSYR